MAKKKWINVRSFLVKFAGILLLSVFAVYLQISSANAFQRTPEEQVEAHILHNYSKAGRPRPPDNGPTNVTVNVYLRSISVIDELRMEFTTDMLLRQYWNDHRLVYEDKINADLQLPFLQLNSESASTKLWVPDTFFPTMRKGELFHISTPNRLSRIYSNGDILLSVRYSATFSCDMDLRLFPFDEQECVVDIGSFSSTTDALILRWKMDNPLIVKANLHLPKFILQNTSTEDCENHMITGNFSCLRFRISLHRQVHFHLIETFLPTTLFVVASWVGFWIDPGAAPARIGLGCVLMLSNVALGTSIKSNLPPVSYIKALDIWLGICICYVFLTLVEYGLVNFLLRRNHEANFDDAKGKQKETRKPISWHFKKCIRRRSPDEIHGSSRQRQEAIGAAKRNNLLQCNGCAMVAANTWAERETAATIAARLPKALDENWRNDSKQQQQQQRQAEASPANGSKGNKRANEWHNFVDLISRICFPLSFAFLGILYGTVLRHIPGNQ